MGYSPNPLPHSPYSTTAPRAFDVSAILRKALLLAEDFGSTQPECHDGINIRSDHDHIISPPSLDGDARCPHHIIP